MDFEDLFGLVLFLIFVVPSLLGGRKRQQQQRRTQGRPPAEMPRRTEPARPTVQPQRGGAPGRGDRPRPLPGTGPVAPAPWPTGGPASPGWGWDEEPLPPAAPRLPGGSAAPAPLPTAAAPGGPGAPLREERPLGTAIAAEVQDIVHEADDIRAAAQRMAERTAALGELEDHQPTWLEQTTLAPAEVTAPGVRRPGATPARGATRLLQDRGSLAQAVVLAEVLGPPRALRTRELHRARLLRPPLPSGQGGSGQ